MKIFFLRAFCICFLIGTWQGWEDRTKSTEEEFLFETAASHMRREQGKQSVSLEYACGGVVFFRFDPTTLHQSELPHAKLSGFSLSSEDLVKVFEGGTGIKVLEWSRTAAIENASGAAKIEYTIATVAGALSGYLLGHYLISRKEMACDSPGVVDKLRDTGSSFSLRVRKEFLLSRINGINLWVDGSATNILDVEPPLHTPMSQTNAWFFDRGDEPLDTLKQMRDLRQRLSWTDYIPTSTDYVNALNSPNVTTHLLFDNPYILQSRFPSAKHIYLTYSGPYVAGEVFASMTHSYKFSTDYITLLIVICIGAAVSFLSILIVQYLRQARH